MDANFKKERNMITKQYEFLHRIYDNLMQNVDYENWADFLIMLIKNAGENPTNILELGCGSGNVTLKLLEKGYEVVGIDISEEMLEIAREKTIDFGNKIILIQQDLNEIDFEVYEIDTVIATNDTFNYITDKDSLKNLFEYLYKRIKNNGQFVFDISSAYKLKNILGNNVFGESFEDMVYLWENFYDEEEKTVTMDINIFEKSGEKYIRSVETHFQRAYEKEEIISMLDEAGFRNIKCYADFEMKYSDDSERLFFVAVK